jgi:hypothetical protein
MYVSNLFRQVVIELQRIQPKLPNRPATLTFFTPSKSDTEAIKKQITNELKQIKCLDKVLRNVEIQEPYHTTFYTNTYSFGDNQNEALVTPIDIGIITIVPEELAAVLDYFKSNDTFLEKTSKNTRRKYYYGELSDCNKTRVRVVVTKCLEQGNPPAALAYRDLADEYNPAIMALVGIAGSIHDKVNICDVIIAEDVSIMKNAVLMKMMYQAIV